MGLDGSGKSTSVDHAYNQLKKRGIRVQVVRAAYVVRLMSGLVKFGKKLLMKQHSDPFSGDYRHYLESMRSRSDKGAAYRIFSMMTTLEFRLQIAWYIRLRRALGYTLLVDRYIYDNVVTYAANLGLGRDYMQKALDTKWKNAPRPDCIVYIKTPIEQCLARKDDIPDPLYLQIREPLYDEIAGMCGVVTISGGQEKRHMLDQVMRCIDGCLDGQQMTETEE